MREMLVRLDQRFPALSEWLGGRLDTSIPAYGVSIAFHVVLIVMLALIGFAAQTDESATRTFTSEVVATELPEFSKVELQELDQPDQVVTTPSASIAPTLGPVIENPTGPIQPTALASASNGDGTPIPLANFEVKRAGDIMMPSAPVLGESVSIKGSGSEHVESVEGAVDRVAIEIMRRLEKGRTLVIWTFDASGSLQAERERLSKHIEKIYSHVDQLDQGGLAESEGLLTTVVAFGQERRAMTTVPTSNLAGIVEAIQNVPLDSSGIESTFGTVAEVIRKWGKFKNADGELYRPMVIVVTDEVGDDEPRLEEAIGVAQQSKVPVYILGSSALFGRLDGRMNYIDPKTGQRYFNLPVRQGPESAALEMIRLPFWYEGPQYEFIDAGFGPWALSRLASETGGIFFVTRMDRTRIAFDPLGMREYHPDWTPRSVYEKEVERSPLRSAVIQAALITQQNLPGQPSLRFPSIEDPNFKEVVKANQVIVARIDYTVNEALAPITAVAKLRDRETSRRWQAHYDLTRGRLLAMKLRCYEFNAICAKLLKDPPKFSNPRSNAWQLVPTEKVSDVGKSEAVAVEARKLLQRVLDDHPGTPWALLAQRELKDPFGFKWVETYVPPPPRRDPGDGAPKKKAQAKNQMPPRPAEPPKL
ncbi:MAG: VWA domain-containing protein [Isosphaeraceae bacterium]|nr:VWA domain-containing protein [Isosphaeraceae bacterium]